MIFHHSARRQLAFETLEARVTLNASKVGPSLSNLQAAIADDSYEANNSFTRAAVIGAANPTLTINNLALADTQDWFRFSIPTAGTSASLVQINFLHSQGDLDLALYNSSGRLIGTSAGTSNQERISLNRLPAGNYTIRVIGYQLATNPNYSVTVALNGLTPPPPPPPSNVDLQGGSLSVPDLGFWAGANLNVNYQVRNTGTTGAGSFRVEFYLSQDNFYSASDTRLTLSNGSTFATIPTVGAGALSTLQLATLVLPATQPAGLTGDFFYLVMRVDSANAIVETNETNNSGQIGFSKDWEPISIFSGNVTPQPDPTKFNITLNLSAGMTPLMQQAFINAAARWEQVIIGDLPNANFAGKVVDDLLIDASVTPIDGAGGILGQAGPDAFRSGSRLPYHGGMEFDTADVNAMIADGSFEAVIMHEMGHVLGVGTIWDFKGLLTGEGSSNPQYIGAQALAQYRALFGLPTATGIPVENTGGGGTRDSHWRESVFDTELMTGYAENGRAMPLSRMTVASMADLGYVVDLTKADPYTRPLVAGLTSGTSSTGTGPSLFASDRRLLTMNPNEDPTADRLTASSKQLDLSVGLNHSTRLTAGSNLLASRVTQPRFALAKPEQQIEDYQATPANVSSIYRVATRLQKGLADSVWSAAFADENIDWRATS